MKTKEKIEEGKKLSHDMNTKLWDKVSETNPNMTKRVKSGGRKMTAIDAYSQIYRATQEWGSYGKDWGLFDLEYEFINLPENQILCHCKGTFKYPEAAFPLSVSGFVSRIVGDPKYLKIDDEFSKKIETDMMTKALSRLGFNADVFMGKFDDNKYLQELEEKYKEPTPECKEFTKEKRDIALNKKISLEKVMESFPLSESQQKEYTESLNLPI